MRSPLSVKWNRPSPGPAGRTDLSRGRGDRMCAFVFLLGVGALAGAERSGAGGRRRSGERARRCPGHPGLLWMTLLSACGGPGQAGCPGHPGPRPVVSETSTTGTQARGPWVVIRGLGRFWVDCESYRAKASGMNGCKSERKKAGDASPSQGVDQRWEGRECGESRHARALRTSRYDRPEECLQGHREVW
jgi:hypothetical protein